MKRAHEPRRLDVAAFATDAGSLEGRQAVTEFARLHDLMPPDAPHEQAHWSARGERRRPKAVEPEIWLHLGARAGVWMTCQRCLQPVRVAVEVERSIRFVQGEDAAARLDADSDDDVLELEHSLDLLGLVEDELLLALPIVPRHERCPIELPTSVAEDPVAEPPPSPFAALESLKRRR